MGAGEWFKAQAFGNPDAVPGAARLDFDQAGADAAHHGLGASAGVQLAENRVHVELRDVVGNVKARGDLLVAESFGWNSTPSAWSAWKPSVPSSSTPTARTASPAVSSSSTPSPTKPWARA